MPLLLVDLDNTLIDRAGAWMVGDSAEADMGGARNAGLPGVWLHRGRPWPLAGWQPGHTAGSFPQAIAIVLAAGG